MVKKGEAFPVIGVCTFASNIIFEFCSNHVVIHPHTLISFLCAVASIWFHTPRFGLLKTMNPIGAPLAEIYASELDTGMSDAEADQLLKDIQLR